VKPNPRLGSIPPRPKTSKSNLLGLDNEVEYVLPSLSGFVNAGRDGVGDSESPALGNTRGAIYSAIPEYP
jgi:hypothetical protein